jgi:hypothetical protein
MKEDAVKPAGRGAAADPRREDGPVMLTGEPLRPGEHVRANRGEMEPIFEQPERRRVPR